MRYLSIDSRSYHRLAQFAKSAGISLHAAATDAVDNWMDLASDPQLAAAALHAIAVKAPNVIPIATGRASSFSAKVISIAAAGNRGAEQKFSASREGAAIISEKVWR